MLLLMWQSFPAEGRQNAHDSFFQEMLQTIVMMPLVGMNVKRHDGGAAMLGTLCVGCQRRVLPRTKPAGASFLALCATRALLQGLWGKEGKMAARQTPLPMASHLLGMGTQPCLQPKRGSVLLPPERKKKKKNGKNNPKQLHPHVGLEQEQAGNLGKHYSALTLLPPSSCLYPPHKFSIFRCCPKGTASKPFESLTFHCCLFDTIIFRHAILKTYQHLK